MPRTCTLCSHIERKRIEEALFRKHTSFRNVAQQFGVTVSALFRHKQHSTIAEKVRKVATQLQKLPPRKMAYVQGRMEGKSKKQAALDAGFTENMAKHAADKIETAEVKELFTQLIAEMIPPEQIAKVIADGLAATETKFFAHEGVVQERREVPAWSERRRYVELAAEYGGYRERTKSDPPQAGTGVILILPNPPQHPPSPVTTPDTIIPAAPHSSDPDQSLAEGEEELVKLLEEQTAND